MLTIPSDLKHKIASSDSRMREEAARELRDYPGLESLRLLKRMLSDESFDVIYAASRSIASIGSREAVAELISLLDSQNARLRNLAIEIISRIGPVAIFQVTQLLDHRDKDIRKFAVDILKMMNTPEAEDPLIQALFDDNINVAATAAEALGSIGTQRAVPTLIECLARDAWLQCAALKSLGELGGDEALTAILATSPDEEGLVLFCAVTALGTIGDSRGFDFLMTLLERGDPTLESSVLPAIGSILKHAGLETIQRVKTRLPVQKIIALLDNDNREVVRSAIDLLGLFREESAVENLVRLYTEPDKHLFDDLEEAFLRIKPERAGPILGIIEREREPQSVKSAAIRLVGKIGKKETYPQLAACLDTCEDELKIEILSALAVLQEKNALPHIYPFLKNTITALQMAAIEASEAFRDPSAIPQLIELSADPTGFVRSKAAKSLRQYDLREYKQDILTLLQNADPEVLSFGLDMIPDELVPEFGEDIFRLCQSDLEAVREIAVERMSYLETDRAFEAVACSLTDPDSQIRLAAIRGLENYPERDVGQQLLQTARSDPAEWNRYEAVQIIGRLQLANMPAELAALLETAPDLVKTAIIDVLGEFGGGEHRTRIEEYAEYDNDLVREAAIGAGEKFEHVE